MNKPSEQRDLILSIYDAVSDKSLWPSVLDRVAHEAGAVGALIFELKEDGLTTPFSSSIFEEEKLALYNDTFGHLELKEQQIYQRIALNEDQIAVIPDAVLYEDIEEFKMRPNVQYAMIRGLLHRTGSLLNKDNPNIFRFSVQYHKDRGPITHPEVEVLNKYLPHLAKALDLSRPIVQLSSQNLGLLTAFNKLNIGVCILDKKGRVLDENIEFKRQKEKYNVFGKTIHDELIFLHEKDQKTFLNLKSDVNNHGKYGARPRKEAINANRDTVLCLEVSPFSQMEEMGNRPLEGHILFSRDTSLPFDCNILPMKKIYGLTNTEMKLIDLLKEGLSNKQIADCRDRSVATINAQVKTILSKTNCCSRAQLNRLMVGFGINYLRD